MTYPSGTRFRVVVTAITPEQILDCFDEVGEAYVDAVGRMPTPTRIVGDVARNGPLALRLRLVEYINESSEHWTE